jgi:hypothetical protein
MLRDVLYQAAGVFQDSCCLPSDVIGFDECIIVICCSFDYKGFRVYPGVQSLIDECLLLRAPPRM